MANKHSRITISLMVAIVTIVGCIGRPLLCQLGDDPSYKDIERYRQCLLGEGFAYPPEFTPPLRGAPPVGDPAYFLSELDDQEVHTFPECEHLSEVKCRKLLLLLETLTEKLEAVFDPTPSRQKRSVFNPVSAVLHHMKRSASDPDTRKLLMMYRNWRNENGYGQSRGRWGRSMDHMIKSRENAIISPDSNTRLHRRSIKHWDSTDEGLGAIAEKRHSSDETLNSPRSKRSLSGGEHGDDVYSILEEYRQWREAHGYGKFSGRWGR